MQKKSIKKKIEELREEMQKLFAEKGSFDEEVLEKSRELDRLLNEFEKLIDKC